VSCTVQPPTKEAYNLLQKLVQGNSAYASEMARVEASLQELGKWVPAH